MIKIEKLNREITFMCKTCSTQYFVLYVYRMRHTVLEKNLIKLIYRCDMLKIFGHLKKVVSYFSDLSELSF